MSKEINGFWTMTVNGYYLTSNNGVDGLLDLAYNSTEFDAKEHIVSFYDHDLMQHTRKSSLFDFVMSSDFVPVPHPSNNMAKLSVDGEWWLKK